MRKTIVFYNYTYIFGWSEKINVEITSKQYKGIPEFQWSVSSFLFTYLS